MKRVIAVLFCLLVASNSAYASDIPDEQRNIIDLTNWSTTLTQAELFDDLDLWSASPSEMQLSYEDGVRLNKLDQILCSSTSDPNCADVLRLHVRAYLPSCTTESEQYCIEDFFAIKDGVRIQGTYKQPYPNSFVKGYFKAEPELDLPAGGSANLWQLPGLTHAGGTDLYLLNAQLFGGLERKSSSEKYQKMGVYQIWSSINAVSEISAPGARPLGASNLGGGDNFARPQAPNGAQCLTTDFGKCLISWPLDENVSLGMTLRFPHSISGWLHGRFDKPDMQTATMKNGGFKVTFTGNPIKVPTVFASIPWSQATPEIKARFGSVPSGSFGGGNGVSSMESAGRNQSSDQMVDDLNLWLPIIKDTASATPTYWMVRTIANPGNNGCYKDGAVNGVVTTNATAYTSGAPIFNPQTQTLDYRVASPHYDAKGGVNIGRYNLQINADVARCLYGFSNAPVSASVSIISSNGENQVATTTLSEKNGWLYLSAAGFTYSSPTVRVKLSQAKAVDAAPTPTQQPMPAQAKTVQNLKRKTIYCVKGSRILKITDSAPRCPAGFKLK
jgi:hypothetical protein